MDYLLPKLWEGRIQKFWDKIMPTGYPYSSSEFALKFDDEATTAAVTSMESKLGTEDSVFVAALPENTYFSNYKGVYDVKGIAGELTLLFPEKVSSDNVVAMHYNTETNAWEKIENIQIKDGYVWGTLESFSPIAVGEYNKEMHMETLDYYADPVLVCEGNTVKVTYNDNNNVVVTNMGSGKSVELTSKTALVGGSCDGSHIDSTNITVTGLTAAGNLAKIYGGSIFYDETETSATVGTVNIQIFDSVVKGVTGSYGAVRTDVVNIAITGSDLSFVGAGECYVTKKNKDVNGKAETTLACRAWVKQSNIVLTNLSRGYIIYGAGNNGYLHVEEANLVIDGVASCDYLTTAGSNGYTASATATISNTTSKQLQFTNRGIVGYSKATVVDSDITLISIGGDNSEGDVDGTVGTVRLDINSGNSTGKIALGVNGTETITADAVEAVKVSRSAGDITVDDAVITVLGDKYIIK